MTDIQRAITLLEGNSCAMVRGQSSITSKEKGIAPVLNLMKEGFDLSEFSIADKIVGRAVAFLYIKAGVKEVYGETMAVGADKLLQQHGIPHTYKTLAEQIINHAGDGICPMEEAVLNIVDPEEAFIAINRKAKNMRKAN